VKYRTNNIFNSYYVKIKNHTPHRDYRTQINADFKDFIFVSTTQPPKDLTNRQVNYKKIIDKMKKNINLQKENEREK